MNETISYNVSLRKLIAKKITEPSVLTILLIFIYSVFSFKSWINWDGHQFHNDIDQYYSYLVAQFIHHDLTFHFPNTYWLVETPTGEVIPKGTMGIALLNLPYFVLADNIAHQFGFEGNGYSPPYSWCIRLGAIFYVIMGLCYLRRVLVLFFNDWITSLTLLLIFFGTNLFYYTFRESEMAHGYLFFLFAAFFYHSIKWHHTFYNKHLFYLCFIAGFITLIRPTEVLVMLVPLFYKVTSLKTLKERFILIKELKWKIVLCAIIFFIPLLPQLIFWKIQTGHFLFFSYGGDEGFFFADPKIYNVLFSWRKGWFIYTPLMLFSMIGLVIMYIKWKDMFFAIIPYFLINLYLISSWWDWAFGGSFGMRALVQSYAFLAVPLAFLIKFVLIYPKKLLKLVFSCVAFSGILFCATTNVFQTWLTKNYLFHWDGMTKEAYMFTFYKFDYTQDDRNYLETLIHPPNYAEMKKGNRDE